MKKLKFYILAMLVPLIFVGCMEKGKSSVEVNVDNPYSFSELNEMIDTTSTNLSRSTLLSNKEDLDGLAARLTSESKTFASQKVTELSDYLYKEVYLPITAQSSTFSYTTTLAKVEDYDSTLVGIVSAKTYTDIVAIKEEVGKVWVSNQTDTQLEAIYLSLNSTVTNMDIRKKKNPYYSRIYDLVLALDILTKPANKTILNNYGIDINNINQKTNIAYALTILNSEIEKLTTNTVIYQNSATCITNLKKLKTVYEAYINGTQSYTNVQNMRLILKNAEDSFANSSSDLVNLYMTKIDQLYTKLTSTTFSDAYKDQKRVNLISRIDKYKLRNAEYNKNNYLIIHSIVTNVLEEVSYLSGQNIYGELGINPGW